MLRLHALILEDERLALAVEAITSVAQITAAPQQAAARTIPVDSSEVNSFSVRQLDIYASWTFLTRYAQDAVPCPSPLSSRLILKGYESEFGSQEFC